jgi:hypothetical protein
MVVVLPMLASRSPASPSGDEIRVTCVVPPDAGAAKLPDTSAFLLGSGLALLIALLAWGEQIRAITKDTRDLERDFLEATELKRSQLAPFFHAKNVDDQLAPLSSVMASGKLSDAAQVELLPLFRQWRDLSGGFRSLQSRKYWLTILVTLVCFLTGTFHALFPAQITVLAALVCVLALQVLGLLLMIVLAGRVERRLNALLMQIAEVV